jgi:hypothetical protein
MLGRPRTLVPDWRRRGGPRWHDILRAERRECAGQIGADKLEDVLGAREILEAVFAEIAQRGLRRQLVGDQVVPGVREQNLAAVAVGEDAGNTIEGWANVVAVALLGGAGVQRHAHA